MRNFFRAAALPFLLSAAASTFFQPLADADTKAPSFAGTDLRGVEHSLEDYEGKPLVLYFWATWCPACRRELGSVNELYGHLRSKGVEMVSISLDQDENRLWEYLEKNPVDFPVIFGGEGWQNETAGAYEIAATPSFVLIGEDQNIRSRGHWTSEIEDAVLESGNS